MKTLIIFIFLVISFQANSQNDKVTYKFATACCKGECNTTESTFSFDLKQSCIIFSEYGYEPMNLGKPVLINLIEADSFIQYIYQTDEVRVIFEISDGNSAITVTYDDKLIKFHNTKPDNWDKYANK
jgi:hypothetical protein